MPPLSRILIVVLILLGLGGLITLAVSGLSPTVKRTEIVIPDHRFPR
jgi:hypothetical protein